MINKSVSRLNTEVLSKQMGRDGAVVPPDVARRFSAEERRKPQEHIRVQRSCGPIPIARRVRPLFHEDLVPITRKGSRKWMMLIFLWFEQQAGRHLEEPVCQSDEPLRFQQVDKSIK